MKFLLAALLIVASAGHPNHVTKLTTKLEDRTLTVRVRVEHDARHRRIDVFVQSEDGIYDTVSSRQLEGADAPLQLPPFVFRRVPPGVYPITAAVDGFERRSTAHIVP
jgi:hypothetical protein